MRIGLLGGTFNPIHCCHLQIAQQTCQRLSFDHILFIPSADPPHKPSDSLAPAFHRLEMVRRATAPYPEFRVSDVEVRSPQTSYTYDTIHLLRQELGPNVALFFLVGLDAFLDFPSWKKAADLLQACHFVVISRPQRFFMELAQLALLPSIPWEDLQALDARQRDHFVFSISGSTTVTLLALPPCDISASTIRQQLKAGMPVSHWLPASVESYIIQHHLYG